MLNWPPLQTRNVSASSDTIEGSSLNKSYLAVKYYGESLTAGEPSASEEPGSTECSAAVQTLLDFVPRILSDGFYEAAEEAVCTSE
jgi:hypothetical protein